MYVVNCNSLQDGLICLFDVSKGSEDDALDSVLNTGSSVVCVNLSFPLCNFLLFYFCCSVARIMGM